MLDIEIDTNKPDIPSDVEVQIDTTLWTDMHRTSTAVLLLYYAKNPCVLFQPTAAEQILVLPQQGKINQIKRTHSPIFSAAFNGCTTVRLS